MKNKGVVLLKKAVLGPGGEGGECGKGPAVLSCARLGGDMSGHTFGICTRLTLAHQWCQHTDGGCSRGTPEH